MATYSPVRRVKALHNFFMETVTRSVPLHAEDNFKPSMPYNSANRWHAVCTARLCSKDSDWSKFSLISSTGEGWGGLSVLAEPLWSSKESQENEADFT